MSVDVLCIEGQATGNPTFTPGLEKKGFSVYKVETGKNALMYLNNAKPQVVIINAASLRSSGVRIIKSIYEANQELPIVLIVPDGNKPKNLEYVNVTLELPFTIRKLVNRIMPFMPSEHNHVLKAGPIELDIDRLLVRCQGNETHLTPRMSALLRILIENKGEIVERENLFRKVWNTEYTEDTRTLDVHISWLRKAIEENPRKPKYLNTVWGVGYRLDV